MVNTYTNQKNFQVQETIITQVIHMVQSQAEILFTQVSKYEDASSDSNMLLREKINKLVIEFPVKIFKFTFITIVISIYYPFSSSSFGKDRFVRLGSGVDAGKGTVWHGPHPNLKKKLFGTKFVKYP